MEILILGYQLPNGYLSYISLKNDLLDEDEGFSETDISPQALLDIVKFAPEELVVIDLRTINPTELPHDTEAFAAFCSLYTTIVTKEELYNGLR